LAVEAIAEGAAGESLLVLGVGFGDVVWSRGVETDGAVTLHEANGYVGTLAGLLDGDNFPLRDSFARGIGHPRSHFAFVDLPQGFASLRDIGPKATSQRYPAENDRGQLAAV